jgi:hypothetical protein
LDWNEAQPNLQLSETFVVLLAGSSKTVHLTRLHLAWPAEALRRGQIRAPDLGGITPLLDDNFHNAQSGFADRKQPLDKRERTTFGYAADHYFVDLRAHPGYWRYYVGVPQSPLGNLACQLVGRVSGSPGVVWGLRLGRVRQKRGVDIAVGNGGDLIIRPIKFAPAERLPQSAALHSSALHLGSQWNTLLVILRGRLLEVYVNSVAVGDPITLEEDVTPARLFIGTQGPLLGVANSATALHAEFQRMTIWPADTLPTPLARGAIPR